MGKDILDCATHSNLLYDYSRQRKGIGFMVTLYFILTYGWFLGMILFAWAMEPKKKTGNTGVRL